MNDLFELLLFSSDEAYVVAAVEAGIDAIVIDWEHINKAERQYHLDTQINYDTLEDLRRVRKCTSARIICRINNIPSIVLSEAQTAADNGADEILVPMVRHVQEIEPIIQTLSGKVQLSLMIETLEAIENADALARLPVHRVYIGLHDLALQSNMLNIFENVRNGTVEQLREKFVNQLFGFGGLTIPNSGHPIPSILLMQEMTRLNCDFAVLRRSFLKDVAQSQLCQAVRSIQESLTKSNNRTAAQMKGDKQKLFNVIDDWNGLDG